VRYAGLGRRDPGTGAACAASIDVRQLSELIDAFRPHGFAQIHRSWAVNLRRVREIRPASEGGWEVKLDPPVNQVLPVSRRRISALWLRFDE